MTIKEHAIIRYESHVKEFIVDQKIKDIFNKYGIHFCKYYSSVTLRFGQFHEYYIDYPINCDIDANVRRNDEYCASHVIFKFYEYYLKGESNFREHINAPYEFQLQFVRACEEILKLEI